MFQFVIEGREAERTVNPSGRNARARPALTADQALADKLLQCVPCGRTGYFQPLRHRYFIFD